MSVVWLKKSHLKKSISKKIYDNGVILDIGCGIKPQTLSKPSVHICCEPFKQYTEYLLKNKQTLKENIVLINTDWKGIVDILPNKSVDSIFLLDVIEHLPKNIAKKLLKKSEKIARKQIVIFTPWGYMPQHHDKKDAWGMNGGKRQEHKSGWTNKDFDKTWIILGCKDFHLTDNMGHRLKKSHGAFYAIKNIDDKELTLSVRIMIHRNIDRLINTVEKLFY